MSTHLFAVCAVARRSSKFRATLGAALLAFALCAEGPASATAPTLSLPDKPDVASVKSPPACSFAQSLAVLTKCASDLELFRITLEDYNGSLIDYVSDLKRSDRKLETLRARARINATDYEDFHEQIAAELENASLSSGKYLNAYKSGINKYKTVSIQVQSAIERCLVSLSCRNASAS